MNWKKRLLSNFRLYAITDLKTEDGGILAKVDQALRGGADIIQLRSKSLSDQALLRLASKMLPLVHKYRKLFFLNDRVDLVLASGADGVHLGQDDLGYTAARRILGPLRLIGRSTHSLAQAVKAASEGHDYIGVGPVFRTPTKPDYQPVGLKLIRQVSGQIRIPFVAIGGIDETNVDQVIRSGAKSVAVVRAVFAARDVLSSTRKLVKAVTKEIRGL